MFTVPIPELEPMMPEGKDTDELWDEARKAILEAIPQVLEKQSSGKTVLNLAEAYAWLTSVNQPHGGRAG